MFNCEKHGKQKELIAIRIYMDDLVIFQYIMEGRDAGNIPWLERKAKDRNVFYRSFLCDK